MIVLFQALTLICYAGLVFKALRGSDAAFVAMIVIALVLCHSVVEDRVEQQKVESSKEVQQ